MAIHLARQYPRIATFSKLNYALLKATRAYSQKASDLNIDQLLSTPTWSVSSLLPPPSASQETLLSSSQLHHLLRLSALPPPETPAAERKMLATLSSQLHFVRDVQATETGGVEPVRSLRDETAQGEKEAELGVSALKEALGREEVRGKWHRRVRRKREGVEERREKGGKWDVLGTAEKRIGRYFVVEGGKEG